MSESEHDSEQFSNSGSSYKPDDSTIFESDDSFGDLASNNNYLENDDSLSVDLTDPMITCEVAKKKSDSGVWEHYGSIKKNGVLVKSCAHKLWCKICFEKQRLFG